MNLNPMQLKRVVDDIAGYCTRCPVPAMRSAIANTVENFCKSIGGIPHHFGPVSANPAIHIGGRYYAVAPFGGVVHSVNRVILNDRVLALHEYRAVIENDGRATIILEENPEGLLEFDIAWRPSTRTTQLPEGWFNAHFTAICHGAIADILSQSGTAWANEVLAQRFETEYSREITDAIYEARMLQNEGGKLNCFDRGSAWL